MPNLMLTTSCNLKCAYCFAVDMISEERGQVMEWPMFIALLDWIDKGNDPDLAIHLMGGEPTLNPHLHDMLLELGRRSRKVLIFSNAALPIDQRIIDTSRKNGVGWVVNANIPSLYTEQQYRIFKNNLERLGTCASLNVTFFSPDESHDYIFDYFDAYDLQLLLKVGISVPTYGKTNTYISSQLFEPIKARLDPFFAKAQAKNITIVTECGVPACIFKELVVKYPGLLRDDMVSHCGSRLDIAPDGTIINCLPLSKIGRTSYSRFPNYPEASKWFHDFLAPYRSLAGCSEQCLDCEELASGRCMVCIANSLGEYNRLSLPPLPEQEQA
jgi:MoaA/NifB/PqqE/SkfB family radical SAM enzyme